MDSPRHHTTRVTRYELVSRGKRGANNELKAGLLGSDMPVYIRHPIASIASHFLLP